MSIRYSLCVEVNVLAWSPANVTLKLSLKFVIGFVTLNLVRSLAILPNLSFYMATKNMRYYTHLYVGWMPTIPA